MGINLVELWSEMGLPVRSVVIVLTIQAIASLAVAVDRLIMLMRARAASKAFATTVSPLLMKQDHAAAFETASASQGHLAALMFAGLKVFLERRNRGDDATRAAELARRAIERKGEGLSDELNRGMGVLASTGSTAPFVGLLGTVLGIISAFQLIAATGGGGIGTIGASIGEALIVTGYGLCVAIPTVLLFNWISGRISHFEMGLTNAGSELADRLETADDEIVQSEASPTAEISESKGEEKVSTPSRPRDQVTAMAS